MDSEKVIKQGIGVVGLIVSAFGGFLLDIAPPSTNGGAKWPVGISCFILLILFLFFRLLGEYKLSHRVALKVWLIIAAVSFVCFLVVTPRYYGSFNRHIYEHEDGELFVKGDKLTGGAEERKRLLEQSEGHVTDQRLMESIGNPHFAGVPEKVWEQSSLERAKSTLTLGYILVVTAIGCTLLSLTAFWSTRE